MTVVIDFRSLDHRTLVRCVARRIGRDFTGRDALRAADVQVRGVDGFGRAFVCRLQGRPTRSEDLRPGPRTYRERCNRIPPTTAYWSYWSARDGGRWRYSTVGYSRRVVRGGFEGWSFHVGRRAAKPPRWSPERPGRVDGADVTVSGVAAAVAARPTPARGGRSARQAAGWLIGDLRGSRLPGPGGVTDWGLTIDALWALRATGTGRAATSGIVRALAQGADDYIGARAYADPQARVAGATAKVLLAAAVAGRDATSFGGFDLRAEVLRLMQDQDAPRPGRFSDRGTGFDSSNTISQATAVIGLALTGGVPAPALRFLRQQQCPDGWFRMYADRGRTCAAGPPGASAPDVDGTAMAVQALLVAEASGARRLGGPISRAVAWLVSRQGPDGSFAGGQYAPGANANSTGLAGQALLAAGRTAAAAAAARWLRSVQLQQQSVRGAGVSGELGAVAYDRSAYTAARFRGIDAGLRDQWRRATAQAVLGLAGVSFLELAGRAPGLAAPSPAAAAAVTDVGGTTDAADASAQGGGDAGPSTWPGWPPLLLAGLVAVAGAGAVGWRVRRRTGLSA